MEYRELRQSIKDMENSKLDSLKIEYPDGTKISMTKSGNGGKGIPTAPVEQEYVEEVMEEAIAEEKVCPPGAKSKVTGDFKEVKSPMVGTFYTKQAPDKPEFVKVGDKVKKGDVLCIIEAMKLMNQIESEYDGEIVEVCVCNESMTQYGQTLFKIK